MNVEFSSEGAECRACKKKIASGLTFCDPCSVTPLEYRKVEALERIAAALEVGSKLVTDHEVATRRMVENFLASYRR